MRRGLRAGTAGRLVGAGLASLLLAGALAVVPTPAPAQAAITAVNLGDDIAGGFTFLSYGNATIGNAETEGAIAVAGTATMGKGYPIIHSSGLTPTDYDIPVVDGDRTRFLAGGVNWTTSSGASDVNSRNYIRANQKGYFKLAPGASYVVNPRGTTGLWISAPGTTSGTTPGFYVPDDINQPAARVAAAGPVSDYLAFDNAKALLVNQRLGTKALEAGTFVTTTLQPGSHGGARSLSLTADKVNFIDLGVDNNYLIQWGNSVRPSATTPIVFNIPVTNGANVVLPKFDVSRANGTSGDPNATNPNGVAPYVIYNFTSASASPISYTIGGSLVSGLVFAPDNDTVTINANSPIEGQIIVNNVVTMGGEFHHYASRASLRMDLPSPVTPLDLALTKKVASFNRAAGTVTFNIEVINQGTEAANGVTVTDYIDSASFSVDASLLTNGTASGHAYTWSGTATATPSVFIAGAIAPGTSVTVPVTLRAKQPLNLAGLKNTAEISKFDNDGDASNGDSNSTTPTVYDVDSRQDATNTDVVVDDEVNFKRWTNTEPGVGTQNTSVTDEDDHDIAVVPVYDVALIKKRATGTDPVITNPANPAAPTATFDITVKNQGTNPVFNVQVLDSPTAPMTRPATVAAQNVNFVGASGSTTVTYSAGTFTIPSLPAGASVTFKITTNLALNNLVQVNGAEITGFDDDGNSSTTPAAWVFDRDATNDAAPGDPIVPGVSPTFPVDSHNDIDHDATTPDPADEDDQDNEGVQLGLLRLGSTVYIDANGDKIGQSSEAVPGVLVVLQKWNGTAWVAAGSTVTNASGDYVFEGLFPGTYRVGLPTAQTGAGVNAAALTGTEPVSSPAAPTENVNFDNDGAAQTGYLSVTANVVLDYGTEPSTDGVDETRLGSSYLDANSNLNIDFVFERYTYELGNLVWLDNGAGAHFDNGIADADERGIAGVTVELYRDNGAGGATANDGILATSERIGTPVNTDANGFYTFKNLPAASDYVVAIVKSTVPQNLAPSSVKTTPATAPTADNDNNAFNSLATLWTSGPVVVGPGAASEPTGEKDGTTGATAQPLATNDARADQTVDFGFVPSIRIGNQVWLDESDSNPATQAATDNNGRFDAASGERGLAGVGVQLWLDANNNGIFERGGADGNSPVATTTTNTEGNYWFSGVRPDRPYFVVVPTLGGVGPVRPASSDGQSAGVDALDNDDDGAPVGADLSVSRVFTPSFGTLPTGEADAVEPGNAGQTTDANAEVEANANGTAYADTNSDLRIDFGFVDVPLYRLGNLVWLDNGGTAGIAADEADGQADPTEPGIPGVTVTLYAGSDATLSAPLGTAVTDAKGEYAFEGLAAGDYRVAVAKAPNATPLLGLTSVRDGGAANGDADNDDNGVDSSTAWASSVVTLGAANAYTGGEPTNEARRAGDPTTYDNGLSWTASTADQAVYNNNRSNLTIDFGFAPIYRVGNLVWFDRNNDGLANADEPGLANVQVTISNGAGINQSTTTDPAGHYVFENLPAGSYTITVTGATLPSGVVPGGVTVTGNGDTNVDNDNNAAASGANYAATVTLGGSEPTNETRFADDPTDDDNSPSWLDTSSNLSVDFGFWPQLRLGNVVWIDESDDDPSTYAATDNNGVLDAGEQVLENVDVTLWRDVNGNGVADAGTDAALGTDRTDGDGNYLFTGLAAGDYVVTIASLPAPYDVNYTSSLPTVASGDNRDHGTTTASYIASSGRITLTAGAAPVGERDTVPVGDTLAEDEATNGGLAPRDSDSDLTIDFSFVAIPTYRIGNLVWLDSDRDGIADASEKGIAGVLVQLLDGTGVVVQETVTGIDGSYDFDGLAAGDYRVRIPGSQTPVLGALAGIVPDALDELVATIYAGDADAVLVDSDSNGTAAATDFVSAPVTVGTDATTFESEPTTEINPFTAIDDDLGWGLGTDGRSEFTVDFGFWPQLRLGNIVWIDEDSNPSTVAATDNNGFLDAGETLLPGVDIEVWNVGANGAFDGGTGDDVIAGTDTTDTEGNWLVTGLAEGTYVAAIRALPAGYENLVSSLGQFTGDNFDHGTPQTGFVAVSLPLDLVAGGTELGEADELPASDGSAEAEANAAGRTLRDSDSDLTLDFSFVTSPLYRIGNLVWLDSNRNGVANAGEPGIAGVYVELLRGGTVVGTDVTDAAGSYSFENLPAGDYVVRIPQSQPVEVPGVNVNALKGLALTSTGTVVDADNDSNGTVAVDYYVSDTVTLGGSTSTFETEVDTEINRNGGDDDLGWAGGSDTRSDFTVDFGFFNGLRLGDLVWFDLNDNGTRDAGEPTVPAGVEIQLFDQDPASGTAAPIANTSTNSQGVYVFTGLDEFTTYWVAIPESEVLTGALVGYRASTPTPSADGAGTNNTNHGAAGSGFATISSPVDLVRGGMAYGESADEPRANTRSGLTLADGDSNLTVDLSFSPLPTYRVGNIVWYDANEDGRINSGEKGIGGVTVELYVDNGDGAFGAGDTLLGSTTTAAGTNAGRYEFADLEPGAYFAVIPGGQSVLDGKFVTSPFVSNVDNNSDIDNNGALNAGDIVSGIVHVGNADGAGELAEPTGEVDANTGNAAEDGAEIDARSNLTVDFGFIARVRIGNQVWLDESDSNPSTHTATDNDGIFNGIETGLTGVEVELWQDFDGNGFQGGAPGSDDVLRDTTVTDAEGNYLFAPVVPGVPYFVAIKDISGLTVRSSAGQSSAPIVNDNDDDGAPLGGYISVSRFITPVVGETRTGEGDFSEPAGSAESEANALPTGAYPDASSALDVDFGFINVPQYRIGNLVWLDANNNGVAEASETPIRGVLVQLLSAGGSVIAEAVTDAQGHYGFDGLVAGTYSVRIPANQTQVLGGGLPVVSGALSHLASSTTDAVNPDLNVDNDDNGVTSGTGPATIWASGTLVLGSSDDAVTETEPTNEAARSGGADEDNGWAGGTDARSNLTVDFGFYQLLRLGDTVWIDNGGDGASYDPALEDNGVLDSVESGVAGVEVILVKDSGNGSLDETDLAVGNTVTDANGKYYFVDLVPGSYFVVIPATEQAIGQPLAGTRSSTGIAGDFATDNRDQGAPGVGSAAASKLVVLTIGTMVNGDTAAEPAANAANGFTVPNASSNLAVDFGFVPLPTYAVGNLVWEDLDNDGSADAGEPGIDGVTVQLFEDVDGSGTVSAGDDLVASTVTAGGGRYVFTGLPGGDYLVHLPTQGALDGLIVGGTPTGADDVDNDNNALSDAAGGWTSALVTLGGPAGPGDHDEPVGERDGIDNADAEAAVATRDDRSNQTIDFGFWRGMRLGNQLWIDNGGEGASYDAALEDNGVYDSVESPLAGVTVQLYSVAGSETLVATTSTDSEGRYFFSGLDEGSYRVVVPSVGADLRSSTGTVGAGLVDDGEDDGAPVPTIAAQSGVIALVSGDAPTNEVDGPGAGGGDAEDYANDATSDLRDSDSFLTIDFGFVPLPTYALGNLVWEDLDNDGSADAGEPGIDGVTVVLYSDGDASGTLTPGDAEVGRTTTAGGGRYNFTGLLAGDYVVALPSQPNLNGLFVGGTPTSAADVDNDNNALTGPESGWVSPVVTLGGPAGPGDHDEPVGERDGIDNADAEAAIATRDDRSNQTIDFGFWRGMRLGNQLWIDNGGEGASYDAALEDNGVYDSVESPLAGVTVQLYSVAGSETLVATTSTDSEGRYFFSGLDEGSYRVVVPSVGADLRSSTGTVGAGLVDDGEDDGAPVPTIAAQSGVIALVSGDAPTNEVDGPGAGGGDAEDYANDATSDLRDSDSFLTIDFGFSPVPGYALGNLVWEDLNNNGTADAGEPGLDGVQVQLFRAEGASRTLVANTTTAGGGRYLFEGLVAGDYEVRIPSQASLNGWYVGGSSSSANDVDNDNNAIAAVLGGWASPIVTLGGAAGPADNAEPVGERDGIDNADAEAPVGIRDDRSNQTVDFGFWRGLRLGNQVWLDEGAGTHQDNGVFDDDAAEVGIGGMTVDLFEDNGDGVFHDDGSDRIVAATSTTADGKYFFEHLDEGNYFVAILGAPAGTVSSTGRAGTGIADDGRDDGAPAETFVAVSQLITLTVGGAPTGEVDGPGTTGGSAEAQANATVGTYPDSSSYLTVDFGVVDVPLFRIGNLVWFDANNNGVAEPGEPALGGVLVQLLDADGNVIGETVTNNQGRYVFTNLLAGTYRVQIPFAQTTSNSALAALIDPRALIGMVPSTHVGSAAGADNDANGVETIGVNARSGIITLGGAAPVNETERAGVEADDDLGQASPRIEDFRSDFSVDFGFYSISLGNLVFFDRDGDGQYEPADGDTGVDGVTVRLVRADTGATAQTTTTSNGGEYLFTGLREGEQYFVVIDASNFVAGGALYGLFSSAGVAGGSTSDSTVDGPDRGLDPSTPYGAVVSSGVITATATTSPLDDGEDSNPDNDDVRPDPAENLIVDFGFYRMQLGGTLFVDADNDGDLDAKEIFFPGVTVLLYNADGTPYLLPNGSQYSVVTDAKGDYVFAGLPAGSYIVEIPASQFAPGGVLEDWANSDGNGVRPDVELNNLNMDDGAPVSGDIFSAGPVRSTVLTIAQGAESYADGETTPAYLDSMSNLTVDFGFWHAQVGLEIGNQLWFDTNRNGKFDAEETAVPVGVEIKLIDAATNTVIGTTYTDAKGQYLFKGLEAGKYVVWITGANFIPGQPLAGWTVTDGPGVSASPANGIDSDSNALPLTATGVRSGELELKAAAPTGEVDPASPGTQDRQSNLTVDFGFVRAPILAFTGADVEHSLNTMALLLALGALLVIGSRRRKES